MFRAFYLFSRPHTILGTTLSVIGLYLIALSDGSLAGLRLDAVAWALVACLGANIYIVGLNQLTDVEIDRINKPFLPLASGAFSIRTGWVIVITGLGISLAIAFTQGLYLAITVVVSLLIGTAYSLPPIRLKRFYFWAAACIFAVRGLVVNVFLFLHFNHVLNASTSLPPKIWALTLFMFGMSLVIAWFKDIPDMEGDRRFAIATLTLRLGPQRVFDIGRALLGVCYLGLMLAGAFGLPGVNGLVLTVTHLILFSLMWQASRSVDPTDQTAMTRYYMIIWTLFFAEYFVYPIACLTA